jgi:DUF177 domain-containing protein
VRIELDRLNGSSKSFTHTYAPDELEFNDERVRLVDPPEISGQLKRKNEQIGVTGRVVARAEVDCDRCLRSIEVPLETEFNLQYVTAEEYKRIDGAELEETDMAVSVFDGEAIDLDEIVREQILLAVPTRSVCQEDCKGFCPVCGENRNLKECGCQSQDIDPRWTALKDLTNRKS